ncbi:unnamed protein product [Sphagnum troendelagicum]
MREKKKQTDKRSAALEKKEKEKQAAGDVLKTRMSIGMWSYDVAICDRGPESKSSCRRCFEDRGPIRWQTRHTRVAYRHLA